MSEEKKDKKKKGDDEDGKPKGKSNLVPAIIIAVGLVLGGKMMGGGGAAPAAAAPVEHAEEEELDCAAKDEAKPPKEGAVVDLDSQTINLADGNGVKVSIALQLSTAENAELFEEEGLGARAASKVIAVLSEEDASITQPEAAELLTEAIRPLYECNVLEVLVPQFVVVNPQGGFLGIPSAARTAEATTTAAVEGAEDGGHEEATHDEAATAEAASTDDAHDEAGSGH